MQSHAIHTPIDHRPWKAYAFLGGFGLLFLFAWPLAVSRLAGATVGLGQPVEWVLPVFIVASVAACAAAGTVLNRMGENPAENLYIGGVLLLLTLLGTLSGTQRVWGSPEVLALNSFRMAQENISISSSALGHAPPVAGVLARITTLDEAMDRSDEIQEIARADASATKVANTLVGLDKVAPYSEQARFVRTNGLVRRGDEAYLARELLRDGK